MRHEGAGLTCEPILTQSMIEALATAQANEHVLDTAGVTSPRLLHGKDGTAWTMLRYATAQGYATRLGLEGILLLPNGEPARDNAS